MPLAAGERLGPYEIQAQIGAGGMGEVYKARDTRLDRLVAVKVSKEDFTERFEREARAVASLNHPHICHLYDVGPNYLVMEYIDGAPIKGPLPLDLALSYGAQICGALDCAHRNKITHRDLKPANILVTKSAGVKLLDFGLAKIQPAVAHADGETLTMGLTQKGEILGTLLYMSPEQVQGHEAGPASDIFSFGLVLYEMLTGKRAFESSNPASVIGAILERPAPSVADVAPASLDRVLKRCLEKNPENRWQTARDLKAELEWIAIPAEVSKAAPARKGRPLAWIAAAAMAVALTALAWVHFRETLPETPTLTFDIYPNDGESFLGQPVISPDGRRLAVMVRDARGTRQLAVRDLDSLGFRSLPGTEGVNAGFAWSPDARYVAFTAGASLKKVAISGGQPQTLCDFGSTRPPFLAWSKDGVILLSDRFSLARISASGGSPVQVTVKDPSENTHLAPQFLPDGRHFLYMADSQKPGGRSIFMGSLDSPAEKNHNLVMGGRRTSVIFAPGPAGIGYLMFERDGALMAQPFDLSNLRLTGEALLVAAQLATVSTTLVLASASNDGAVAYSALQYGSSQLTWFDRRGKPIGNVGAPTATFNGIALAPDGKRVAVSRNDSLSLDIWILDLTRGTAPVRFTFGADNDRAPIWSRDGAHLLFGSGPGGSTALFRKPANLTSGEFRLLETGTPVDWSPDGTKILYSMTGGSTWTLEGSKTSKVLERGYHAQFSPDGKWIAYDSDETKQFEVWVQSFPSSGGKFQVSAAGGRQPRWSADGKELFYVAMDGKLTAVPVKTGATFEFGAAQPLFDAPRESPNSYFNFAVAPDGQRFLMTTNGVETKSLPITIVTNWLALAKK